MEIQEFNPDDKMASISTDNFSLSSATLIVLDMDHLIEEILSHLHVSDLELQEYRLVNQKWNDVMVRKITKSRDFFQVKLRYGTGIPELIVQSDAQRWAGEILESATRALTMTSKTVTRLPFDALLIDRDFFLAGLLPQWLHFLEVYGETIRHLKIDIRSSELRGRNVNYVEDCEVVMRPQCLRALFRAVPNLESLDLCIRFTHYGTKISMTRNIFRNYRIIPKLMKLVKITIQEPHKDVYPIGFVKGILSMAPNLNSLYIKPSFSPEVFADALKILHPEMNDTLRTLRIKNVDYLWNRKMMEFPRFNLTRLEIHNLDSVMWETPMWIEHLLQVLQSTLITLILGNREPAKNFYQYRHRQLNFSVVMSSLKILEISLTKFELNPIQNYQHQFPVLENITLTIYAEKKVWAYRRVTQLLPGDDGRSNAVKKFSLLGQMQEGSRAEAQIIQRISTTFPNAELIFGL